MHRGFGFLANADRYGRGSSVVKDGTEKNRQGNSLRAKLFDDKRFDSLVVRMRRRRFARFRELLNSLPRSVSILDVGGTEWFWRTMGLMPGAQRHITLLNRMPRDTDGGFASVVGDGCAMSMFSDRQFDAVVCNSVIEHVGGWDRQRALAAEIRRVGRMYYLQTPNRRFPIEAHTRRPWFQYWPEGLRARALARRNLGVFPRQPDRRAAAEYLREVRLLSGAELRQLFPGGTLYPERFLGLVKSWVVIGMGTEDG